MPTPAWNKFKLFRRTPMLKSTFSGDASFWSLKGINHPEGPEGINSATFCQKLWYEKKKTQGFSFCSFGFASTNLGHWFCCGKRIDKVQPPWKLQDKTKNRTPGGSSNPTPKCLSQKDKSISLLRRTCVTPTFRAALFTTRDLEACQVEKKIADIWDFCTIMNGARGNCPLGDKSNGGQIWGGFTPW